MLASGDAGGSAGDHVGETSRKEPNTLGINDFVLGELLGEGSFGAVYLGTQRATMHQFAVKVFTIAHISRLHHGIASVMTEKKALVALEAHPSIVNLHFAFKDNDHLYLVLDYASGGVLFDQIRRLGACHINCARWLTAELVNALEFIHSKRIIHRDLKPENILLDDVGHIKLVDFGSARLLDSKEPFDPFVGTAEYLAPEVLRDEEASEASDLWALGCIVFQMLSGAPPFQVVGNPYLTMEMIKTLDYAKPKALDSMPESARLLVLPLLHPDPHQRLGAGGAGGDYDTLRAHAFFTEASPSIDFSSLTEMPPPPLVPPLPQPSILDDGSVLNAQLAQRGPLNPEDRASLLMPQRSMRWHALLHHDQQELIILATQVLKRRHLSVKRRQLILAESLISCGSSCKVPSDAMPTSQNYCCRLFYVDSSTLEYKGCIPWSPHLHAELLPKGQFRVHTPGRTYYLEDASGDDDIAELWVQTICNLQARREKSSLNVLVSDLAPLELRHDEKESTVRSPYMCSQQHLLPRHTTSSPAMIETSSPGIDDKGHAGATEYP